MKKLSRFTMLLLATNLLTVSALIWGCGGGTTGGGATATTTTTATGTIGGGAWTGGAPVASACPGNCYNQSCTISPPFSTKAAYIMVSNYRKNHWMNTNGSCPPFRDNPDETDARSAWFNLDTLKAFINTIETMSCKRDKSCPQLQLGIRIYYAEYPSDTISLRRIYGITNAQYAGMHTLLMIPTFNDSISKQDIDFDPFVLNNTTPCQFKPAFDSLPAICALPPTTTVTARNHGGLIPPPYKFAGDWNNTGARFMWYVDVTNDQVLATDATR